MPHAPYLDYNSGAPVRPQVVTAMTEALAEGGNPSSTHGWGRRARARLDRARTQVAAAVGADAAGVIFTSGGTEANALALRGAGRKVVLVSAIEHASVLNAVPEAMVVPVTGDGIVDVAALERILAETPGALVSVMLANNETGIVQPLAQVVQAARTHGALVHCDAAQALGRMPLALDRLGVDLLTLSAHKAGGPAGVGALVLADPAFALAAMVTGGGQELRRRGGTENVAGIVGFGVAAEAAVAELPRMAQIAQWRDDLAAQIAARLPTAQVIGGHMPRLPNTLCVALSGVDTRTQVMALDLDGVMIGAGAACSSGKLAESGVLRAMQVAPEVAAGAIRLSWGWNSSPADGAAFLTSWIKLAQRKGVQVVDAAAAA